MKVLVLMILAIGFLFASVDINTADVKELATLKGIGKTKAEAIVNYREDNCFKSVNELSKVKGIGKKTVEKNKDDLTVSECK